MKLSAEQLKELRALCNDSTAWASVLDELIAIRELKGDQVPVDDLRSEIQALMRTYALVSSPCTMAAAHDAGYAFVKAKGFNRILAALSTAPQKPVVPVGFLFVVKATGAVIYSIADAAIEGAQLIGQIYGDAAIEAAGGIVKDGE